MWCMVLKKNNLITFEKDTITAGHILYNGIVTDIKSGVN